jgi:hypothetical protein
MATNTHSQYVILTHLRVQCDNGCTNAPQLYVIVFCLYFYRVVILKVTVRSAVRFPVGVRDFILSNASKMTL